MFDKNKYYTDKSFLVQILDETEDKLTIKIVDTNHDWFKKNIGDIREIDSLQAKKFLVEYNLNNPLTKIINKGVCHCEQCECELHFGDECVVDDDNNIFCSEDCLLEYHLETTRTINEDDLDDSETEEVPLFRDFKIKEN